MDDRAHLLEVILQQHKALDHLMAKVILLDTTFRPTQSGHIWDAVVAGSGVLKREGKI